MCYRWDNARSRVYVSSRRGKANGRGTRVYIGKGAGGVWLWFYSSDRLTVFEKETDEECARPFGCIAYSLLGRTPLGSLVLLGRTTHTTTVLGSLVCRLHHYRRARQPTSLGTQHWVYTGRHVPFITALYISKAKLINGRGSLAFTPCLRPGSLI